METNDIKALVEVQNDFFFSNQTKPILFRINALKTLKKALLDNEQYIMDSLWSDLHKSNFETYALELGIVLREIDHHIKKLKKWSKPKRIKSPIAIFPSKSRIYKEPYGTVLIISPWNYPILLLIDPLVGAISAGNTVVLKPSPYLKAFSRCLDQIINENFNPEYISVVHGGREVNQQLLSQKWDYIFFTGSSELGKIVMKAAAENLTPVCLELGGKSPCIVDEDANLKLAARRIVWGKFINGGQTCIAPDYLLVHEKVKAELLSDIKLEITKFYGGNPKQSPDFCRIVNKHAFDRLLGYLNDGDIIIGGDTDEQELYISPTVIDNVDPDFPVMQEEIFGPILPVISFTKLDRAIKYVNMYDKPLAFYYFSNNIKKAKKVLNETTSGGGCINDTILHISNSNLPFGGVGNSGMGKYHGRRSFDIFTNERSIVFSSTKIDIPLKYAPYTRKLKLIKFLLKL